MEYDYIRRIENRAKEKKITIKRMLLDLGYSDSMISQWKRGSEPSAVKLTKIAEYLDLDIGYILTGNKTALSQQELELIAKWNELDSTEQEIIQEKIETMLEVKHRKEQKLSS